MQAWHVTTPATAVGKSSAIVTLHLICPETRKFFDRWLYNDIAVPKECRDGGEDVSPPDSQILIDNYGV